MLLALVAVVGGLAAAIWASRIVVHRTVALIQGTSISPFVSGLVLLALGTDLPEIANSVASSLEGHGDINVGDSIGSAVTQSTLILGLLPLIGGMFLVERQGVISTGVATVIALGVGAVLMADGWLGRADALLLIAIWVVASYIAWRVSPQERIPPSSAEPAPSRRAGLLQLVGALVVVGVGATVAVNGFVSLAGSFGLPEYIVSFFLASIGTSLPELVVDTTALRHRQRQMAIGGLFGATLLDATASLGAGPLLAPTAVTADLAMRGSILALVAVAIVTTLLVVRRRHDRRSAVALLALYAISFPVILGA